MSLIEEVMIRYILMVVIFGILLPSSSPFGLYAITEEESTLLRSSVPTLSAPPITFPTDQELYDYYSQQGTLEYNAKRTNLSNETMGNVTDVKITSSGNNTYVLWLSQNISLGSTDVYASVSNDDGVNLTMPVKLNHPDSTGHIINLHAASEGMEVYTVWQQLVNTTNSSVFASTSMDGGQSFKTWMLSNSSQFASNPQVSQSGNFVWIETISVEPDVGDVCLPDFVYNPITGKCEKSDILYHRGW